MSTPHGDIGPELRRLAQAILDRLDPALQAAASAAAGRGGSGRCQQVWCPVCALAALISGEQHPLLTVVAEHSVALMAVLSAMVAQAQSAGEAHGGQSAGGQSAGEAHGAQSAGEARVTPPPPTDSDTAPPAPGARDGSGSGTANGASRYQHIPIVVEPVPADD